MPVFYALFDNTQGNHLRWEFQENYRIDLTIYWTQASRDYANFYATVVTNMQIVAKCRKLVSLLCTYILVTDTNRHQLNPPGTWITDNITAVS